MDRLPELLDGAGKEGLLAKFGDRLAQDARVSALDEAVDLERLGRCHLDLFLGQDRHERHTEGLELLRAVPHVEHREVISWTEAGVKSASRRITGSGRVQLLDDPVVLLDSHRRRRGQQCDSHHQPPTFEDGHILPHTMIGPTPERSVGRGVSGHDEVGRVATRGPAWLDPDPSVDGLPGLLPICCDVAIIRPRPSENARS